MNALEFLNGELSEAGLNFNAYEIGMQGNGATADIGFEGDSFPDSVSIRISDEQTLEVTWFSGRCDASKALEFARMMQAVAAIASKWEAAWEAAIEDEKQNNRALRWAKRDYPNKYDLTQTFQLYLKEVADIPNSLTYGEFKAIMEAEFPIHTCEPKPESLPKKPDPAIVPQTVKGNYPSITDTQVETLWLDIVKLFKGKNNS